MTRVTRMLQYEGAVFRPPSEANSLIIQATIGCSNNTCTFCVSYKGKRFRIREFDEIRKEVELIKKYGYRVRRIFLADGNALTIPTSDLLRILDLFKRNFPSLERVSAYACSSDILGKSIVELKELKANGLSLLYHGLESGDEEILEMVRKQQPAGDAIKASEKLAKTGIDLSTIVILGLGGKERSEQHAINTGKVVSKMKPRYLAALTLMIVPGSAIERQIKNSLLTPLNPVEGLKELKIMIENINGLSGTVFRTNHASNYLPLRGLLCEDKEEFIQILDNVNRETALRPEWARGL
ncbi:MAG: radical SAM protein [Candidatus Hodarchaeales archaeon]